VTIRELWPFVRRWAWLVVALAALGAAIAFAVSTRLPRVYVGTAVLLVAPGQASGAWANYNDILAAERVTRTYARMATRRPVVEEALQKVGFTVPIEDALKRVSVVPVRDTQLIQISARADTPEEAALLANAVTGVFVQQMGATQSSRFAASKDGLKKQVDELASQVAERTQQVEALKTPVPSNTPQPNGTPQAFVTPQPTSTPNPQRAEEFARLQTELTQLQTSYTSTVRSYEEVRLAEAQSADLLTVADPATPPDRPVSPRVPLNVALGAALGALIAAGAAYLTEHFDDRLTSAERLTRFTGLHVLGLLPDLAPGSRHPLGRALARAARSAKAEPPETEAGGRYLPGDWLVPLKQIPPGTEAGNGRANGHAGHGYAYGYGASSATEAFRLLQANLQFAAVERPLRTLLVSSCDVGDGKSTVAANLAVVLAQGGKRVLLVDADLRRPTLHERFHVVHRTGLTTLLVDERVTAEEALCPVPVDGLSLVTSGPLPPNPSELLASARMRQRLAELRELADLVVIDSPPVLAVSDPAVLAGLADGTLLVVNARRTRGQAATQVVTMLEAAGGHLLGAVLNRVPRRKGAGYYGYGYEQYGPAPGATPAAPPAAESVGVPPVGRN
jgi:non-specific protein-tyrosine kinase